DPARDSRVLALDTGHLFLHLFPRQRNDVAVGGDDALGGALQVAGAVARSARERPLGNGGFAGGLPLRRHPGENVTGAVLRAHATSFIVGIEPLTRLDPPGPFGGVTSRLRESGLLGRGNLP